MGGFIKRSANRITRKRSHTTRVHPMAQIIEHMKKSRCALMPTRTDAQGLMMCEMASTGMPLITSDIPVCHEVFDDFENVALINNDLVDVDLTEVLDRLECGIPYPKNSKYYGAKTSQHEVDIIKALGGVANWKTGQS